MAHTVSIVVMLEELPNGYAVWSDYSSDPDYLDCDLAEFAFDSLDEARTHAAERVAAFIADGIDADLNDSI